MPTPPPSSTPGRTAEPRLLSGAGGGRDRRSAPRTEASTARATVPVQRPGPQAGRATAKPATPRWLKGFVIGGVLLAVGMPAAVLISRSMLVQQVLTEQSSSKASMVCTGGDARAADGSGVLGWLFGGSYF